MYQGGAQELFRLVYFEALVKLLQEAIHALQAWGVADVLHAHVAAVLVCVAVKPPHAARAGPLDGVGLVKPAVLRPTVSSVADAHAPGHQLVSSVVPAPDAPAAQTILNVALRERVQYCTDLVMVFDESLHDWRDEVGVPVEAARRVVPKHVDPRDLGSARIEGGLPVPLNLQGHATAWLAPPGMPPGAVAPTAPPSLREGGAGR
eukprot:CAMPEP_0197876492 /NCGR_PEP_ID=MMETSP1439-20131203/5453_1 /TAXON_ID=66791 /ORGANISM="Gonyaulax spinifera, Strain CCMP409" /LENGTH=204 /DNA_ID=CAMNT_0043495781 /DNA_START=165 /DNA_END=774 /DNA_ORIENTATION=+